MYAVVRTGGKQYKLAVDDIVRVEKLPGEKGDTVELNDVLMIADDSGIKTGADVENAKVTGQIVVQDRAGKIIVFKKWRRKDAKKKQGHRQAFTELKITGIA